MSNHRLKFRWEPDRFSHLVLIDVWCPGDHGGDCGIPEVSDEIHDDDCASLMPVEEGEPAECDCGMYGPTGRCWVKTNIDEFASEEGWDEILQSSVDLPWLAVTIDGPGVDGNDPLTVKVVAEVKVTVDE